VINAIKLAVGLPVKRSIFKKYLISTDEIPQIIPQHEFLVEEIIVKCD
jgi:hypothetical protein